MIEDKKKINLTWKVRHRLKIVTTDFGCPNDAEDHEQEVFEAAERIEDCRTWCYIRDSLKMDTKIICLPNDSDGDARFVYVTTLHYKAEFGYEEEAK